MGGGDKIAWWRYALPNGITFAGMLVGLWAVMQAGAGHFVDAGWLIILCVLIDKLDGTAARLLKAQSDLGGQLDSFSDLVTFGIAPAALVYFALSQGVEPAFERWTTPVGRVVLAILAGSYVVAASLRLAKFNLLEPAGGDKDDRPAVFYGMPTTHAGGIVAAFALLTLRYEVEVVLSWAPLLMALLAVAMLIRVPLPKVVRRRSAFLNWFQLANAVAAYICGIFRLLPEYLGAALVLYAVLGFGWGFANRARLAPPSRPPDEA